MDPSMAPAPYPLAWFFMPQGCPGISATCSHASAAIPTTNSTIYPSTAGRLPGPLSNADPDSSFQR